MRWQIPNVIGFTDSSIPPRLRESTDPGAAFDGLVSVHNFVILLGRSKFITGQDAYEAGGRSKSQPPDDFPVLRELGIRIRKTGRLVVILLSRRP